MENHIRSKLFWKGEQLGLVRLFQTFVDVQGKANIHIEFGASMAAPDYRRRLDYLVTQMRNAGITVTYYGEENGH